MNVMSLFCLIPVLLIFAPMGFASMVTAIAKARRRDTKRLFAIAGFGYTFLTIILLVVLVAIQWYWPEITNMILMWILLVAVFGLIIAPLIGLVIRLRNPDLFRNPRMMTTTEPSNVPMTPGPEAPAEETRSAS